jgi:hypothetical protein
MDVVCCLRVYDAGFHWRLRSNPRLANYNRSLTSSLCCQQLCNNGRSRSKNKNYRCLVVSWVCRPDVLISCVFHYAESAALFLSLVMLRSQEPQFEETTQPLLYNFYQELQTSVPSRTITLIHCCDNERIKVKFDSSFREHETGE